MRIHWLLFHCVFFFCSFSYAQQKENRVALVIGNSAYKSAPLKNPINDSKDMSAKLKSLGFTVVERSNLNVKQIGGTLREFRSKLTPGSVALVFYAGHGLQIKGENYLPAVDADIGGEEDVPTQSLALRQIMDLLEDAKTRLNLVFLDACRNNPFTRSFRSYGDGLSRINAPSGTLISFATRPGSLALDGYGRNGLYTSALLEQMNKQSQPIEQVLKKVVTQVKAASNSQQEPWMEGSIEGDFCFGGCGASIQSVSDLPFVPTLTPEQKEERFWEDAKVVGNIDAFTAYLQRYPKGTYVDLAKANISRLNSGSTSQTVNALQHKVVGLNDVPSNADTETKDLFKKAKEQNDAVAQVRLGYSYQIGAGGLAKDEVEALKYYRLSAGLGNAQAQNNLGHFYFNGLGGLAKDELEALRLFRLSSDQGNPQAQVRLGYFFEVGRGGLSKDEVEAGKLYRLSANQGNSQAQNNLGTFYELGLGGFQKDPDEAKRLYQLAARQNNTSAQNNLKRLGFTW